MDKESKLFYQSRLRHPVLERASGGHEGDQVPVCPPMIVADEDIEEIMVGLVLSVDQFTAEIKLPVSRTT